MFGKTCFGYFQERAKFLKRWYRGWFETKMVGSITAITFWLPNIIEDNVFLVLQTEDFLCNMTYFPHKHLQYLSVFWILSWLEI